MTEESPAASGHRRLAHEKLPREAERLNAMRSTWTFFAGLTSLAVALVLATFTAPVGAQPSPPRPAPVLDEIRTIDGSGNNLRHEQWGSAGVHFRRLATDDYADGVGEPAGQHRAGARLISNVVFAQEDVSTPATGPSDFVWQWGQFLDHDIDLTPVIEPAEFFDIEVPVGDPWFDPDGDGDVVIPLDRSFYRIIDGARQQTNEITAYIDGSVVYGSDRDRARELRTLDGSGRLATSDGDLLPFNTNGFPNAPSDDPSFFLGGDFRANEQVGLTAMHTLFVREHNLWADRIARKLERQEGDGRGGGHPPRGDRRRRGDEIYELARAIVAAEIQHITFEEFLPVLLGDDGMPAYTGYRSRVDASISNEFATAAYRFGHSMLSPNLLRRDRFGDPIDQGDLPLAEAFFRPDVLIETGIDPLLRGLSLQVAQRVDAQVIDAVRNFLFGPPGSGGFDLVSLNIQRGRDHGLSSYNVTRAAIGLAPAATFADISGDTSVQAKLASVYESVDDVDLWAGGLAEDAGDGLVGETFGTILRRQFLAIRDGDRFWYARYLPERLVRVVERQTLARIIRRNTDIGAELSADVFHVGDRAPR